MKLSVAILAFATLAVSAAHAAECDMKLYDAVSIPELDKCDTEAGFDFVELTTPTDEVKAKWCKSEACLTIGRAAKAAAPTECTVKGKQLYADVLDPLQAACKKAGVDTSSGTSSSANATSSHGSKNSSSHGHSHASGSMDSSDDDSAVKTPSNSTTKPTTTPASAATPSLSITAVGVTAVFSLVAAALL